MDHQGGSLDSVVVVILCVLFGKVRKLDERQMRVQKVLAMVEDIINLRECAEGITEALEEGDLHEVSSGSSSRSSSGGTKWVQSVVLYVSPGHPICETVPSD